MYHFKALHETSPEQLAECFNAAFSDYEHPIRFTPKSLEYYLTASAVDLSLSFGAFCGDLLVGFILNSSGIYHGQEVVFDAGTGIIPEGALTRVYTGPCPPAGQSRQYTYVISAMSHKSKQPLSVRVYPFVQE